MSDAEIFVRPAWELIQPGAPRGVTFEEPKFRSQDNTAESTMYYAVVFFPRITTFGPAVLCSHGTRDSLSQSPEAAVTRFMDSIKAGENWEDYQQAGWKVRKVLLTDLGDA